MKIAKMIKCSFFFCLLTSVFCLLLSVPCTPLFASDAIVPKAAVAAEPSLAGASAAEEGLSQRIALELRGMDIVDALKFLAMKGGVNIIAGKDVTGQASLFLKDVTIKDALDIILLANNLAYENRQGILYVMTESEYKLLHGNNYKDKRQVKLFKLKYAKPEAMFKALDLLRSDIGKLIVDEDSGTVIIIDTPEKVKRMEETLASLDQMNVTRTFYLQYAKAKDVLPVLLSRLDAKKTGTVALDERSNALIVTALPDRMTEVAAVVKGMDKKTKQVLLEAKILKVVLNDDFTMGVDWDRVFHESQLQGLNFAEDFAFPSGATTDPTNFFKFGLGNDVISGHDFSAIIKILQEFGETRNLSSPSVVVTNGEEAKMMVGSSLAYVTTTLATGSTTSSTAAAVTFLDVGVQLTVTPIINDDGFVQMKIKPEVSSQDGSLTYTIQADVTNTVPLVAKTTTETTVMVKDGHTIVMGGMRKDEKVKTVDKTPGLGNIPVLGALFRKSVDRLEKTEIVVFITPRIITGDQDAATETGLRIKGAQ